MVLRHSDAPAVSFVPTREGAPVGSPCNRTFGTGLLNDGELFFARESPELTWEGGWALATLFIVDARRTFFSLPVIPRFLLAPARIHI